MKQKGDDLMKFIVETTNINNLIYCYKFSIYKLFSKEKLREKLEKNFNDEIDCSNFIDIYRIYGDSELVLNILSKIKFCDIKLYCKCKEPYTEMLIKELEKRIDNGTYICSKDEVEFSKLMKNKKYSKKIKEHELKSFGKFYFGE